MAYNPKSKRTNPKGTPQQIKSLNGLTANKNIDDIRALSKISNSHDNSIDTLNSDVKIINGEISSLQKTKQDNIKLTTIGTSGPATLSGSKLNIPDYSGGLGGFVPYIGATQNVDLGEFELKAGQIEFDQTPTGTPGVAIMQWNDQDGTVDLGLKGGNVTLQIGQEQVTRVVNKTGIDLLEANYQTVRVDGAQGNRLKVALAQANNDANSAETLGIVTETINDNQEGFITTSGLVRNINTTGSIQGETWADGDMLYLSGTVAGQLTNIKPTAPIHTIIMGYVVRAHATQGQIYVKVDNGYELDELHNVAISSPLNNQGLFYETATQLWKNKSIDTALGYTPVPTTRQLTINGTTYDLSANRTWSVGTVTSVTASAPLSSSGGTTPNITISQASSTDDGYLSAADWTTFNSKQPAGNYITALSGEASGSGPGTASVTLNNASVTAKVLTGVNITGGSINASDSILTAFGKLQNQINGLIGSSVYQGTWNASTNTPALASGVGTRGYYYIVNVAGSTNLDGITDWNVGDWAIFDGTAWQQVDNTDSVTSVNGQTGAVSLTTDNIPEGATNLYFTNLRARQSLSLTTTGTSGAATYNNTTGVLNIPQYQSVLTNPVTGTGATNYVARWTSSSQIGTGVLYDDGSYVGIGTSAPDYKLDIRSNTAQILSSDSSFTAWYIGNSGVGNAQTYYDAINGDFSGLDYGFVGQNNVGYMEYYVGPFSPAPYHVFSSGNVGIGTTAPSQKLHVSGNLRVTGAYYDSNNSAGTSGQVLSSTGSGTDWVSLSEITGVDGTGTANYISKWLDANTITNSVIYENGSNIGIGITNADYPLTVGSINVGGAGASLGIIINSVINTAIPSSSVKAIIGATNSGFGYAAGSLLLQPRTGVNAVIAFTTEGSEKMRITHSGDVGIGTSSPGFKTTITADITKSGDVNPGTAQLSLEGATTPGKRMLLGYDTNGNGFGFIKAGNYGVAWTPLSLQPDGGNVGIGTNSPSYKLDIVRTGAGIQDVLSLKNTHQTVGVVDGVRLNLRDFNIESSSTYGSANNILTFGVGTSKQIALLQNGNVGIGTTSPGYKLQVETGGDGSVTQFRGSSGNSTEFGFDGIGAYIETLGTSTSRQKLRLQTYNGNAYTQLLIDGGNEYIYTSSNAKVGIGTSNPQARLDVNGGDGTPAGNQFAAVIKGADSGNRTLYFDGATQASVWWGSGNTPQFAIDSISGGGANFWTNNGTDWSERMRIQVNGDIAINTTVASYKLDVNGWFGALRIYPYNTNSTYFAGDTGGITVNGPGYLYAASSGGSYFEGNVRIRGALSNDTAGYLQINGGTANLTYFAGTIGVGSTSIFHSASITSAGKIFLAQTNNSDIGGTIYGYWDTGYQAYAGGLVFQSFNANGGTPYTMKDVMWLTGNGNLGVGTNNTFGNKVAINRGVSGTPAWNNATLELRAESSLTAALVFHRTGQSEASIYSDNGSLVFGEFGGERMRITGGNVGIGTSSPGAKLEVSGLIKTNRIQLTDGASNGYVLTSDASGNGTWQASVQPFTGNAIPTKPLSGGGYMTYLYNTTTSTTSTANILYLTPFIPINTIRSSSIFIQVVTPSAGSTAKIVVYSDSNGSPSSLLIESPLLDCSTSGFKVYALNYNFIAGTTYWVSVVFSSSTVSVTGNSSLQIIAVRTNSNAAWNSFSYTLPSYPTIPATLSLGTGNFSNPASVPRITIVAA